MGKTSRLKRNKIKRLIEKEKIGKPLNFQERNILKMQKKYETD